MRSTPWSTGNGVVNSLSRMILQSSDDSPLLQQFKANGFHSEVMDTIEHAHPYGFSMRPKGPDQNGGAEIFTNFLGAARSHAVGMLISDRRYRPNNLQEGEVVIHDDGGTQQQQRDGSSGGGGQGQGDQPPNQVYLSRDRVVVHSQKEVHVQRGDAHGVFTNGKVKLQYGSLSVTITDSKVLLGSESANHAVMTVDGPSQKVFAVLGETDQAMQAAPVAKRTQKQQGQQGGGGQPGGGT